VTRAENVNQVTQRDKSGTERDKGRQCESGYAKRQERATLEECKEQLRGSVLKYLKTENINLPQVS
jgi:hypothetical protein